MRLISARVREFKSIWDSNEFSVGEVTSLVGKNEAGKTALLQALYRLNPVIASDGEFDVTDDYPRSEVENYQQDIEGKKREPATVVQAVFELEQTEIYAVEQAYGKGVLASKQITVSKAYPRSAKDKSPRSVGVRVNEKNFVQNLVASFAVPVEMSTTAQDCRNIEEFDLWVSGYIEQRARGLAEAQKAANALADGPEKAAALEHVKTFAEPEASKKLRARVAELKDKSRDILIWQTHLLQALPKFLYFDEYYQLRGHDNVGALKQRMQTNSLQQSDHPLLGLIHLARLDLDKLISATRTQDLKNKLQGASNHLSGQILKYWSQNRHLRMDFDVREGRSGDPAGMREGVNIWGEVFDTKRLVSTGLATRSRGFVWFFSFLAWYASVKKNDESLVLLLDEPGVSLHGKAQEDLLRYFETEIVANPKHQLLYTTHSPFMIDTRRFDRVRIVQDRSVDADDVLPREESGTKVLMDVLDAGPDALFPLQGALGYEIYQSLFIGPNTLIVEGSSDLLYIQAMSALIEARGGMGLDGRWTISPVGGVDKVPAFVALVGSQRALNVAVLIDVQRSSHQVVENLYKRKLLKKSNVLTFADFTGKPEADIEDMFEDAFYLQLVNGEYTESLTTKIKPKDIQGTGQRLLVRVESFLEGAKPLKKGTVFNHFRPARYFATNATKLKVPAGTMERFEAAFVALNALL
jgi:predicted ATPase